MAVRSEVWRSGALHCREGLGPPSRREPQPASFPLLGRVVRTPRAIVQMPVLSVFHPGQSPAQAHAIAP
jgi:hypothetical protein